VAFTLLATVLSVIVQGAMMAAKTPFGIPTLTATSSW
jgi:urea transporter